MDLVLGIDGGGTKTDVALADASGRVRLRLRRPGLDPTGGSDWEEALAALAAEIGPVRAAVLGLPFHDEIPAISQRQTTVAQALFGAGAVVLNDVAVAFDGAFGGAEGVLILAGTGSMAWARGPNGTHRVGGWGDVFGDEGSAFWIGREALARASQELDGRRTGDGFAAALLGRMGLAADHLVAWVYDLPDQRKVIAGLAREVSALAQSGQLAARALMTEAGVHLAAHGLTALRLSGAAPRWSFAGGVMADPEVMRLLAHRMGGPPTAPKLPPVGGALLRAAALAGWPTDAAIVATLQSSLADENTKRPPEGQATG